MRRADHPFLHGSDGHASEHPKSHYTPHPSHPPPQTLPNTPYKTLHNPIMQRPGPKRSSQQYRSPTKKFNSRRSELIAVPGRLGVPAIHPAHNRQRRRIRHHAEAEDEEEDVEGPVPEAGRGDTVVHQRLCVPVSRSATFSRKDIRWRDLRDRCTPAECTRTSQPARRTCPSRPRPPTRPPRTAAP